MSHYTKRPPRPEWREQDEPECEACQDRRTCGKCNGEGCQICGYTGACLVCGEKRALDAAEQRAAEAEAHLRAVVDVKGTSYCPWCHSWLKEGHKPDCPRQAAAKWLSVIDGEEHGKED